MLTSKYKQIGHLAEPAKHQDDSLSSGHESKVSNKPARQTLKYKVKITIIVISQ